MKFEMIILEEAGYKWALRGLSKNKKQDVDNMPKVAQKLKGLDNGHNKFLESIQVWFEINAPRYWWQEFDTYRIGGTKQSESTMHTLVKDDLEDEAAFEEGVSLDQIRHVRELIDVYHGNFKDGEECKKLDIFLRIKGNLPEGFLQRRVLNFNYKSLRHIYKQRKSHRLPHWKKFCATLLENLEHPEFITSGKSEN